MQIIIVNQVMDGKRVTSRNIFGLPSLFYGGTLSVIGHYYVEENNLD